MADSALLQALQDSFIAHATRPCLVDGARVIDYRALSSLVQKARAQLGAQGIHAGQLLPILARRTPESIALALAALHEGVAFAWLPPKSRAPQLRRVMDLARPNHVVLDDPSLAQLAGPPPPGTLRLSTDGALAPAQHGNSQGAGAGTGTGTGAACVLFTSGSTGAPRGVRVGGDDLLLRARGEIESFALGPSDVLLSVLPFSFDVGLNQLVSSLLAGAALHLSDAWLRLDVDALVARAGVTGLSAVPTLWSLALGGADGPLFSRLDRLRYVTISGGSLPPHQLDELGRRLGPTVAVHKTYGQTETFRSTQQLRLDGPPDSVGRALPGVRLRLAPDGEIIHAGTGTMLGYLGGPAVSEVHTGDHGRLDANGNLFLLGRSDGMIKSAGHRFYPREIEEVLARFDGVREAVAFGLPDARLGERVVAVITAGEHTDVAALRRFAAGELPSHMVPAAIARWPELPRTASGKPALAEIRAAWSEVQER